MRAKGLAKIVELAEIFHEPVEHRRLRTSDGADSKRGNKKSPQQAAGYWDTKAADRKHAASCGECIPKAIQRRQGFSLTSSNGGKSPGTQVQQTLSIGTKGTESRRFLASKCGTVRAITKSARGFAPIANSSRKFGLDKPLALWRCNLSH